MSAPSLLRRWLASHSVLRDPRDPRAPVDEDWYSSVDTRRVALQLRVSHQLLVGWASGQHAPTVDQARALEGLGGPPADAWTATEPARPVVVVDGDEDGLDALHLEQRCACAAHQVVRAASDYETLPVGSRRALLRKILATAETTEAACAFRLGQGGAHELEDVQYLALDRPDAVPFEEWEAEAWARVERRPSTLGPHKLSEYLAREERSVSWFARHIGESDAVVESLAAGRSRSVSVQLAFSVQEAGGPSYLNWLRLDEDERQGHRARPALVWDVEFVAQAVPKTMQTQARALGPLDERGLSASRGMHHLRRWVTVQKIAQTDLARACGTTRARLLAWVCGTHLPTLQEAWEVYRAGGPPVYSWLHDPVLYAPRPNAAPSSLLVERLEKVRGVDPDLARRAVVERYKEQARWAVSRPVSGAGPKPAGEALDEAYDVYRRRCEAARVLLRAGSADLAEAVEAWERQWAVEYVDGEWVPPWERIKLVTREGG